MGKNGNNDDYDWFSLKENGKYDHDFSIEDLEDDDTTVEMALSDIDGIHSLKKHPQVTRLQHEKKVALYVALGFLVAIGLGLIPLSWKNKQHNDEEDAFVGNALKLLGENHHMISCSGNNSGKISLDEWLDQDMQDITTLCDPEFHGQSKKAAPSETTHVKVFIMMGESNMVGAGLVHGDVDGTLEYTVSKKKRFAHLIDNHDEHNNISNNGEILWNTRDDVRYVAVRDDFQVYEDRWLSVDNERNYFGIEQQFGYVMGEMLNEPVLIIKSASGRNTLGGDILPPTSRQYEKDGFVYPGYGESPQRWRNGEYPIENNWQAGMMYDESVANIRKVLHNINKYYPGASTYEISGFVWWQGNSDRRIDAYVEKYEENLSRLIQSLQFDFRSPDAKFVTATLGQNGYDMNGNTKLIFDSQMNISSHENYPGFTGSVATVDTRSSWRGPFQPGHIDDHEYKDGPHYGNNAETFLEVGNAVGLAMARLLLE